MGGVENFSLTNSFPNKESSEKATASRHGLLVSIGSGGRVLTDLLAAVSEGWFLHECSNAADTYP